MPDAELSAALKQTKGKKMFFAFIPKGGSDGQLGEIQPRKQPEPMGAMAGFESGGPHLR